MGNHSGFMRGVRPFLHRCKKYTFGNAEIGIGESEGKEKTDNEKKNRGAEGEFNKEEQKGAVRSVRMCYGNAEGLAGVDAEILY